MKKKYLILISFLFLLSCSKTDLINTPKPYFETVTTENYILAIKDAETVSQSKIYKNLIPILVTNNYETWKEVSGNAYVLMVVFTRFPSSYPAGQEVQTSWGYTWVTVFPQIKNFIASQNIEQTKISIRVKEVLGLPPSNASTHFIEIWVKPGDLFRPCPDNEITDTQAELDFPQNTPQDYKDWFESNKNYTVTGYPWTRLGYTYDWGNPSTNIGLSEYVITKNAKIIVEKVKTTEEYFQ